jgi:hypothetical protein
MAVNYCLLSGLKLAEVRTDFIHLLKKHLLLGELSKLLLRGR